MYLQRSLFIFRFVPKTGLEPARLSTLAPETSASTNSAIWASSELACNKEMRKTHFGLPPFLLLTRAYKALVNFYGLATDKDCLKLIQRPF